MKMNYFQPKSELSPDLEWMLASHQVSSSLLLETLLHEYYTPVYRLAFSILDDPQAAQQTTLEIFSTVLLNVHHYRAATGVENWLFKIAWKVCMRSYRRERRWSWLEKLLSLHGELTNSNQAKPANDGELVLWQAIDELDDQIRFSSILNLFIGWSAEKISVITGIPLHQADARLELALEQITGKFEEKHIPAARWRDQAAGWLENRWPAPIPDDDKLSLFVQQIEKLAHRWRLLRGPSVTMGEMAVLIAVVVMVLGLAWWGNRFLVGPVPSKEQLPIPTPTSGIFSQSRPTDDSLLAPRVEGSGTPSLTSAITTETPEDIYYVGPAGKRLGQIAEDLGVTIQDLRHYNRIPDDQTIYQGQWLWVPKHSLLGQTKIPTPVAPVTYTLPTKDPITTQDLNFDLYPSQDTYHTVWLDAVVTVLAKSSQDASRQMYRLQLWLSDNEGLLVGGPVNQGPAEVLLWLGSKIYVAKPGVNSPWFQGFGTQFAVSAPLLYSTIILVKQAQIWDSPNLFYIEPGNVAGRGTWILKAIDGQYGPVALIDLDKKTGFVLRYQQIHDNKNASTTGLDLPDEITVRKIDFDVNFPQDLFDPRLPWRGGYSIDYSGNPAPVNSAP